MSEASGFLKANKHNNETLSASVSDGGRRETNFLTMNRKTLKFENSFVTQLANDAKKFA